MEALDEGFVAETGADAAEAERRRRFLARVDVLEAIMLRLEAAERMWAAAGRMPDGEGTR
jgi:hypothetical protein